MSEIFISYSRRNKSFVQKLIDALKKNGYTSEDIWVDWEDIPSSSQWEREIEKGIQDSNAIIFVLSPEFATSKECAKELKFAVKANKRLFPIVYKNVDPKIIPDDLASLNWIFMRSTDNFTKGLQSLQVSLKTDLEHAAQHTNILGRARKWDAEHRDASSLLRGSELTSAESWLAQATENKQPRPTQLQRDYIIASRRDDTKRQRQRMISVVTALVVSLLLAFGAAIAGLEALRQSQRAMASQLAALSSNLVDSQPDLSLLLSLEANYIGDELGEYDPAWLGSLITSMNSSPKLGTYLRAHQYDVRGVAFSPDGHWLATVGGSPNGDAGEVVLWDATPTDMRNNYQSLTGGTKRFLSVAFSPDSKNVAAAGADKIIFIWDPYNCCAPIQQYASEFEVRALSYVEIDGELYLAAGGNDQVTFWNVNTGELDAAHTLHISKRLDFTRVLSLAVSANGLIAVGDEEGFVTVWDLSTKEMKYHVCSYGEPNPDGLPGCIGSADFTDVRGLAFNKNGSLLVSASSDNRAWLWSASTGELLARTVDASEGGHINTISSVAFNPSKNQVATVSWDNTVRLWNVVLENNKWTFKRTDTLAGHSNSVWAAAFTADGKRLATGSSDTTVIFWRMDQINQIGMPLAKMHGHVWALTPSWDEKQLAAGDEAGIIRIWNFKDGRLGEPIQLEHEGGVLTLAYSRDNKWLASAGYDHTIRVWDTHTGEFVWEIPNAHADEIWQLMFSPDDALLASISYDKTAKLWNTSPPYELASPPLEHEDAMFALAFNENGMQLMTAGYTPNIFLWNVENPASPQRLNPLTGHSATVNSLAFNWANPPLLASTSDDKSLLVWDLDLHEHSPKVVGLNESMEAVTFNPLGNWLASATNNSTVLLWKLEAERCAGTWDSTTCRPTLLGAPLVGHNAAVQNVVFLSNEAMVSSSEDGQLIFWNLDKVDWYEKACQIVNRPFAAEEYNQYVEGRINILLLSTVNWFTDTFGSGELLDPPTCIQDSLP